MKRNTILVKDYSNIIEEYKGVGTLTPGFLVEVNNSGNVRAHSTEGGSILPMVVKENSLIGKTIDDNYLNNEQVQVWVPGRGDIANLLLADGETVAIGDFVQSKGDGTVKKYLPAASAAVVEAASPIVGVALEAVDMSGSAGVDPSGRILVRIL